jgi:EmrB/QacA subfamily drug resistance transporter
MSLTHIRAAGSSARAPATLAALLVAAFAITIDTTIVNVALPTLVRTLHASNSQLQWVVDAYNLTFAALLLPAGSISDRVGRKGMLLAGLAVVCLSNVAGGLASNLNQLIIARCFMGAGAAMVFPATLSLIANVFPDRRERARAVGLWGAATGMAIALGPIVGGWLLESYDWTAIFFAMVPAAALGIALAAWSVPTSRDTEAAPLDRLGFLLSAFALALGVFTIIEAPDHGWSSARTLLGFGLAALLGAAFLLYEQRSETPMLDIKLFRDARFSAASISVTVALFTLFGFILIGTQYFQFLKHYGPLATGVRMLPLAVSVGVGSIAGTKLAIRYGAKLIVTGGLIGVSAFYLWSTTVYPTTSYGTLASQMVLYGLSLGLVTGPATEAILGAVPKEQAGVGSAVNDATRLIGGTLGVAIMGSVYASVYATHAAAAAPSALPHAAARAVSSSVGAALQLAGRLQAEGHGQLAGAVTRAALPAFHSGLVVGCLVAAGVALAGALAAVAWLPAQPVDPIASDARENAGQPLAGAIPAPRLSD